MCDSNNLGITFFLKLAIEVNKVAEKENANLGLLLIEGGNVMEVISTHQAVVTGLGLLAENYGYAWYQNAVACKLQ